MITAIETRYNGYRFRSRLEARWAIFFDALDVKWEYEPEGFDLYELACETVAVYDGSVDKARGILSEQEMHLQSSWFESDIATLKDLIKRKQTYYLPDFHLPTLGYIEIKPFQGSYFWGNGFVLPRLSDTKILHGMPGTPSGEGYELCIYDDVPYFLGFCPVCKTFSYGYMGWAERICKDYKACGHAQKTCLGESEPMIDAIIAARSARFEHGEKL